MRNPYDRVVAFEKCHGDYYELLDRYCKLQDTRVFTPLRDLKVQSARKLLREHNALIQQWMGYMEAHRELKRAAESLPQEGSCPYA